MLLNLMSTNEINHVDGGKSPNTPNPLRLVLTTTAIIMAPDANPPSSPSQALADLHLSLDSHSASGDSPPATVNGIKTAVNGHNTSSSEDGLDPIHKLQQDLERTREERDELAAQYRNLLGKLQNMRNTLGNKLKQDAVRTPTFLIQDLKPTRSRRKSSTGANSK